MKILVVTPNLPLPIGGLGARNYHLLQGLAHEHDVSLLAVVTPSETVEWDLTPLRRLTNTVRVVTVPGQHHKRLRQVADLIHGRSHLLAARSTAEAGMVLDEMLRDDAYDAVLFESVLVAGHRVSANVPVIIDQHNIEHEIVKRTSEHERSPIRKWYSRMEYRRLKPGEIERCRAADAVVVTSERERRIMQRLLPGQAIHVVPNGVDLEAFRPAGHEREIAGRIVFTGSINYYPNTHAVLFFARQCWPRIKAAMPDATWEIVGINPPARVRHLASLPGVTVTGAVPDVRPHLAAAAVAIVPVLIGSGTRLKILEAHAMEKAVVSTTLGCEGLAVVPGHHLLVEDDAAAFADAVIALLRNPHARQELGTAGRKLVEDRYNWERSGEQLLWLIETVRGRIGRSA